MKLLGMWMENYGSFSGRHHFSFADRGICLVLGQNCDDPRAKSNGSGKSTLVEAPEWCLFGEPPRGDGADSVVNDGSATGLCVTLQLVDDEGRLVQVQRLRDYPKHKSGPRLWVDGVEVTKLDASETQKDIERHVGLDRQVWRAAVFFAQNETFNFADATDAQQKQILTKILQLDEIDEWALVLEELVRASEKELTSLDPAALLAELRVHEAQNPQERAANWDADQRRRKAQAEAQDRTAQAELYRVGLLLTEAQQAASSISQSNPEPQPPAELRVVEHQISVLTAQTSDLQQRIGQERGRFRDAQSKWSSITEKGTGTCTSCGQPVTAEHLESEKTMLLGYLSAVEAEGKALAAQLAICEQQAAQQQEHRRSLVEVYQALKTQHYAEHNEAVRQRQQVVHMEQTYRHAAATAQLASSQHVAMAQEVNPYVAEVQQRTENIVRLNERLRDLERRREQQQRRQAHLKFWKTGFGAKGLKSYVLDSRLEEMTLEVNRWVHLLTGGVVWVRFETQKQVGTGAKKKLSDTFSIRVFRHNPDGSATERNYRSWSGGEKHRIALGIDFGLARLVASRSRSSYDLLILDEVFQKSLDSAGKEAVAELLQQLAKEKSTILVVDHDIMFQGLFEETLIVEKRNGRSRVLGSTNAESAKAAGVHVNPEILAGHPAFPQT
jgi:DNA repair exonuclease SbcCD ATPase subunit